MKLKKNFPPKLIICQKVMGADSSYVFCGIHHLSVALPGRILAVTDTIFLQYLQGLF